MQWGTTEIRFENRELSKDIMRMKKRLFILMAAMAVALSLQAQQYVVMSITGKVEVEASGQPKHELRLREVLKPTSTLNIGFKSKVEILDEAAGKKYELKVPGKGRLSEMMKDRQNSAIQLTAQYLAYTKKRLKGNGELTSRHYSDPATVTREVAVSHDSFEEEYRSFQQKAQREYEEFRLNAIRTYADFLKEAWKRYGAKPPQPRPQEKEVKPVVATESQSSPPTALHMVAVEEIVSSLADFTKPQPKPSSPIREQPEEEVMRIDFNFYGTPLKVRFNHKEDIKLRNVTEKAISEAYTKMASLDFNNTIRDCLELRVRYQLSDWAYLQMLDCLAQACCPDNANEATLLMAFLFQQSGYKMRLASDENLLVMLYSSEHIIYDQGYFILDGDKYYVYKANLASLNICQASFPGEMPLSLCITQPMMIAEEFTEERTLTSKRYPEIELQVSVNKNLLDFYESYPSSMLGGNQMSRWAFYANAPLENPLDRYMVNTLRTKLEGLSTLEAAERILNWVQTSLEYKFDEDIWGHDRAFFAEETVHYPYCDCEDRSILFSRLIRELLGLKVVLVYYPGHLATAVCFGDEQPNGDCIILDGDRYIVCDPTYIGARVGRTMPGMDNAKASVILLEPVKQEGNGTNDKP